MSQRVPDRLWSGIDVPKTVAGVLAAVTAAFLGSFLGVAGTLAGAALASIFGSVGTELYHRSLQRGREKLQNTFVTAPAAVGTPLVAAAAGQTPSSGPAPSGDEPPAPSGDEPPASSGGDSAAEPARTIRWKRVALVAGAFFVVAIGALTTFELISGTTVPAAVGAKAGTKCTVCSIGDKHPKVAKTHHPAPTQEPASAPASPTASAGETAPSAGPTATATPSGAASPTPSGEPSAPAATPSDDVGTAPTGPATPATPATPTPAPGQDQNQPAAPNADLHSPDEGNN